MLVLHSVRVPPCVPELKKKQFVTKLSCLLWETAAETALGNVSSCPTSGLLYLKHTKAPRFGGTFSQEAR